MAVYAKLRYIKFPIPCEISGNLLTLLQPQRFKYLRDFITIQLGRIWSSLQPPRSQLSSLSRYPIESWILTNFLQSRRSNFFTFGVALNKSGNFLMYWQLRKFICVKLLHCILCREKKNQNSTLINVKIQINEVIIIYK